MSTPTYTLLDDTPDAEAQSRSGPYQVYPEVYYAVHVSDANPCPVEPLVLRRFRVAEADARAFYDVPASTPAGAWIGPPQDRRGTGVRFRGSARPLPSTQTPEGAILQYWRDLGHTLCDADNDIANTTVKIEALQEQRTKAANNRFAVLAARTQIEQRFRTIPEINDARLAAWIKMLPPVIPIDGGKYAVIVPPKHVRTDSILSSTMLKSAVDDVKLAYCGTHLVYARDEAGPTLAEVYACIEGHVPNVAEFFRVVIRAGSEARVQPDPHQPGGYCAFPIVFLRTAQPGE